jgi:hypothetical protein
VPLLAWAALAAAPAVAQAPPKPTIALAPAITAEPASQTALPIRVGPADAVPARSFLRVRGLPSMAALSEGHSIAPGAWAVPLASLTDLKITLPAGASGRAEFTVALVAIDGAVLAEAKSVLNISPARQSEAPKQPKREAAPPATASILRAGTPALGAGAAPEAATPPTAPQPMTPQDRERAERLMKRGDEHLQDGNVAGARLYYERAAEQGLPQAAMALAATYDAAEIARRNLRGVTADAKAATRWYQRASQLGAAGADERLRRISGN